MPRSGQIKITFFVFVTLFLLTLTINLWMVLPYMLAVLVGGLLAILCMPVYRKLVAHRVKPKLAASLVLIGVTFLVLGPLGTFATVAVKQGIQFGQYLSQENVFDVDRIMDRVSQFGPARALIGNPQQIETQVKAKMREAGAAGSGLLLSTLGSLPEQLLRIALSMIAWFFLMIDGRRFIGWMNDKIPLDSDVRAHIYQVFRDTTISTILATLAAALAQAAIMFVAFLALGVPAKFLAAGATFIFAWIPILGSTPVWLAGAAYLYVNDDPMRTVMMLAAGAICSVADNFVRPMVLKGRSDMHPLVALVAIFGGIQMFGLLGVFIGPILAALLLSLFQVWPVATRRFSVASSPNGPVIPEPETIAPLPQGLKTARSGSRPAASEKRQGGEGGKTA